jgi:hypothetical protein
VIFDLRVEQEVHCNTSLLHLLEFSVTKKREH